MFDIEQMQVWYFREISRKIDAIVLAVLDPALEKNPLSIGTCGFVK